MKQFDFQTKSGQCFTAKHENTCNVYYLNGQPFSEYSLNLMQFFVARGYWRVY